MTLEWNAPEMENGIIRYYIIQYYEPSAPNTITPAGNTTETTFRVVGLRAFTDYVFRVSAVTVEEGPSTEINVKTAESSMYI